MSSTDERIVSMKFDNAGFEAGATKAIDILDKLEKTLAFNNSTAGIENVKKAIDGFDMDDVSSSVEECSSRFQEFETFVTGIFANLKSRAENFGMNLVKNLTVKPLVDGFGEYQTQMQSVQTILSNAGDKLKEQGFTTQEQQIGKINQTLDELNTYADKTIYNFSEMTKNIGTFTAAGVDLDTATQSIQGIANLAAASGATSQQASTAMYQLSQAIASGTVKLMDWNSVVNAGMGGELFQNALKRTARAHGVAVDEMIEKNGSFRESLFEGWLTSDILTETLGQLTMATEGLTDAEIEEMKVSLENQGYSREDAEAILELANNAQQAATKVRTWTQLWDTVGEALGSGWATTWRTIVGDFLEATDLFTHLSDGITGIISASSNARNAVLADWAGAGGRTALVDGIKYIFDAIMSIVKTFGEAFSDVFGISAEQLFNISAAFATFAEKLVPSQEAVQFLYDLLYNVFTVVHSVLGIFGNFIRIVVNVASVVWKLISPFVKLVAILAGGVVKGLAVVSSLFLKITDYIEGFIGIVLSKIGAVISIVYGGISKLAGPFGFIVDAIKGLLGYVPALASAFVGLIAQSEPFTFVVDSFKTFGEYVKGKAIGAVDKLKTAIFGADKQHKKYAEDWDNLSPFQKAEVVFEDVGSRIEKFSKGFAEASDKVEYLKDAVSPAIDVVKDKFSNFFKTISSPTLVGLAIKDMITNLKFLLIRLVNNIFGQDVAKQFSKGISSLFDPVAKFIAKSLVQFRDWGEVVSTVVDNVKKALGDSVIGRVVKKLTDYFSELANSGKSVPDMIGTVFLDVIAAVKYGVTHIPELLSKAVAYVKKDISVLVEHAKEFKDKFATNFKEAISKMPSPEEIGKAIGTFITKVRDFFSEKLSGLFKGGSKFTIDASFIVNMVRTAIENAGKLLSGIKISIPDNFVSDIFSGIGTSLSEAFGSFFEGIDVSNVGDAIDTLLGKIKDFFDKNGRLIALVPILDFIHSLSSMNKGIGKFGKTFGKNFRKFGESIGEGLSNFGQGFTSFKKQTKAQAFMRIAGGMLILAAALWVLSKIPSDRLLEVAFVLGGLAVGISALALVVGGIAKLADIDLDGVGKAIAGFGIGILALSAAVWVFSKIPADQVDESIGHVRDLIALLGITLIGISKAGGDLKGAAATLVAMAAAVILLMIPIEILGRTPDDVLKKGGNAVGLITAALTGAISLMELANVHKSSILGAAPTLLALAISITLLVIPIEVLGRTDDGVLHQGGNAVGLIAGVLSSAIGLIGFVGKHSGSILAATPAMLALVISISLAIIPIKILGKVDQNELHQGGNAVGLIAAVLGGVIALIGAVGSNAGGILAGSIGLIALSVAVGIMALIVSYLTNIAAQHPEALGDSIRAVIDILGMLVISLAAIGAVGVGAGIGLAAIAGGIALLGLSLGVLAGGIMLLQYGPDWGAIADGINNVVTSIQEFASNIGDNITKGVENFANGLKQMKDDALDAGRNAIQGFLDGIGEKIGALGTKAQEVGSSFIQSVKDFFGIKSPSTVMADIGTNVVQGLIDGIGGLLGSLGEKASEIGSTVVNGVGNFAGGLISKAGEGVSGFIGQLTGASGSAQSAGEQIGNSAASGMETLVGSAAANGVSSVAALAKSLSRGTSSVNKTSGALNTTAVKALRTMANGMRSASNSAVRGMVSALKAGVGSARSAGAALSAGAKSGASKSSLYSTGSDLASGFARGISGGAYKAINAAAEMAAAAIRAAKKKAEVKSPSRVFKRIGMYVSEGFAIGIRQGTGDAAKAGEELAASIPEAFSDILDSMSIEIEDILNTDYNPEITPVINATEFNSGIGQLQTALGSGFSSFSIGSLNYTGELSAKIDDYNDLNRQMVDAMSNNQLDYNLLGVAVANALIRSGIHVEMDGGQLMGYLAGEISDARRMYG